jgi:hypothetical protein
MSVRRQLSIVRQSARRLASAKGREGASTKPSTLDMAELSIIVEHPSR